jgi:flagellar basal-body rod protein FlgG
MPSGLYIAASGMDAALNRQGVVANNLANLNTVGFKQNRSVDLAFPTHLFARIQDQRIKVMDGTAEVRPVIGFKGGGVIPQEVATDHLQGPRLETTNPLDFALTGPGFFAAAGPSGQLLLTRGGNFSLDPDGRLVTQDGYPVLGRNGEVFIDGSKVEVDEEGNLFVDGKAQDQLRVVTVSEEERLQKAGHSLFSVPAGVRVDWEPESVQVQQGFLEQSNVNAVREMVEMIEVARAYELNARIVSLFDDVLSRGANEVGSLRG